MLPELQICNPSNPIRRCHPAHPGYQSLQIFPLEELHPLGQCGLLVVVPVQAKEVDRSCHGLEEDRAPEGYCRFTGFLVVALSRKVARETRWDYECA